MAEFAKSQIADRRFFAYVCIRDITEHDEQMHAIRAALFPAARGIVIDGACMYIAEVDEIVASMVAPFAVVLINTTKAARSITVDIRYELQCFAEPLIHYVDGQYYVISTDPRLEPPGNGETKDITIPSTSPAFAALVSRLPGRYTGDSMTVRAREINDPSELV